MKVIKHIGNWFKRLLKLAKLRNIRISWKYLLAFCITAILFLTATVVVYTQLTIAQNDSKKFVEKSQLTNDMGEIAVLVSQ